MNAFSCTFVATLALVICTSSVNGRANQCISKDLEFEADEYYTKICPLLTNTSQIGAFLECKKEHGEYVIPSLQKCSDILGVQNLDKLDILLNNLCHAGKDMGMNIVCCSKIWTALIMNITLETVYDVDLISCFKPL